MSRNDHHPFLNPTCGADTLDVFGPRHGILTALRAELPNFTGVLIDVGCGRMPYKGLLLSEPSRTRRYIGIDLGRDAYGAPDVLWDGTRLPVHSASADCVLATEVFEHCPDPALILAEIFRVLKPGGMLFFTVPFLWPLHDSPHDEFRYTPFALERLLRAAGFARVNTRALGGWDAALAQMLGLWIRRRPMHPRLRRLLSIAFSPVVRRLFHGDQPPSVWKDQTMLTGIAGTAFKHADA